VIRTVTPNPSFDHTYQVPKLELGEIARAQAVTIEAAGKGVNVARTASVNGTEAVAVMPGSASDGAAFRAQLEPVGVTCLVVDRVEPTRRNITVVDADGTTTKVNEGGPALDATMEQALIAGIDASPEDLVAGCGSLAPGTDPGCYAHLSAAFPNPGAQLALDSSGEPLHRCLDVPCLVAKPNRAELEELLDVRLDTYGQLVTAAGELVGRGWSNVLVSLGPAGAVLVNADGAWHGTAPIDMVGSTVGAGDALLTGYLCDPVTPERALASALAFARASVRSTMTAGTVVGDDDRAAVQIGSVNADQQLGDETG